jgi:hypothetical protein
VTLVALHAVQTAAVDRNHGALHIDQIILAQLLPFPNQRLCHILRSNRKLSRATGLPLRPSETARRNHSLPGTVAPRM